MIFYLGTHKPQWLADERFRDVPLFVSRRSLASRRSLPRAVGKWALDSGGFTELSLHGRWTLTPRDYAANVRRFRDEIGGLTWAAPQDWMCEPAMLAKTGLSVAEHQALTVVNFLELRDIAPDLPIAPVLQGWSVVEYWQCADLYERAGVDLQREKIVGVGTVCRRQGTAVAAQIMKSLGTGPRALALHGFGFKAQGVRACGDALASADSLAWSYHARRRPPIPEHTGKHGNCANCAEYALSWRAKFIQ